MPAPILEARKLAHWYGNVGALSDVSLEIGPGVTGVLGPNGAGKTSLMRLAAGVLRPTSGAIRVLGEDPWDNPAHNLRVGICPEHDGFPETLTGRAFLEWLLRLRGRGGRAARVGAARALERVRLAEVGGRRIGTYSRGMRQRLKLAQALAHDPALLLLDEPLTGTDPLVRQELIRLIRDLAAEGRHVLVSSHVLHEIEALTRQIVVFNGGRMVASGDRREIRALIDRHPHKVEVRTPRPRDLGAALARQESVSEVRFEAARVVALTTAPDAFYARLPHVALEAGCAIEEVVSPDDDLDAVFRYLTERR